MSVKSVLRTVLVGAALALLTACATVGPVKEGPIEVQYVRMTAAGKFVDLRYRVTDAEEARKVLGARGVKFLLRNERTGRLMQVPVSEKLGNLRQTRGVKPGHTYFMLFQGGGLKRGDTVTAQIGELEFRHLRVQ